MYIAGLQKLSLVDYPGKVAAVVFTQGCVFRCSYCHNPDQIPLAAQLVDDQKKHFLSNDDVLKYLDEKKYFLDGVCITGGEPTLQADLGEFMRAVKDLGMKVKLDSNGVNPGKIKQFFDEGLVDYIAMDIKSSFESYDKVINVGHDRFVKNVQETMRLIQDSGIDHEFRTTVFPAAHTAEDFMAIGSYLRPGEKYYIQNIEYKNTFDKDIDQSKTLDVVGIIMKLRERYPEVVITERK